MIRSSESISHDGGEDPPKPRVSVVMSVYNGERYLAAAIDSILQQTFSDFELLIVDDGSNDNSAAMIREYAERDGRIRFWQHKRNRGQADAQNTGLAAARGTFITRMDCDDISKPQRLEKQVAFMDSTPEIGCVGTCGQVMTHNMKSILSDFKVPSQHAMIALYQIIGYGVLGASLMFRREFVTAVRGYEPGRRAVDDLELISRLLQDTRIRFANLSESLYLYRRHEQPKFRDPNAAPHIEGRKLKHRNLRRLGFEAPEAAMARFARLGTYTKLSWSGRRTVKKDLRRLIEGMIRENWVEAADRTTLHKEMNRLMEIASPRLWQKFCHWRRHRFGR